MLDWRTKRYRADEARTSYAETDRYLTQLKKTEELAFLNEVSSVPLQQALRHQSTAFAHFFAKRARYPRFKSRNGAWHVSFAVTSDGDKIANPRLLERNQRNLARYERRKARKCKGSENGKKAARKVAAAHGKVRRAREDFLHKTTTELVRRYDVIVVEDLHVFHPALDVLRLRHPA